MTTDNDTTRIVRSWLEEGRTTLPDWVRDDVLDRLPSTPQGRAAWPARRFTDMSVSAKLLVAAAAVIVVAVLGIYLLPRAVGPGSGLPSLMSSPTPTRSAEPTLTVSRLPDAGPIEAGTYILGATPMEITVPSGWEAGFEGFDVRKHPNQPNEVSLTSSSEIRVYPDACATNEQPPLTGPSADDLVAALQAQRNSDVSEPLEITVDGHPGVRVEISVPEGLDPASCTDGIVRIWEETVGYTSLSESETAPMSIVQTDLGRIVFSTSHGPEASEEDLAELDAIVASMVIND